MNQQAQQYQKRDNKPVIAVQLDLDFEALQYQKWGGQQQAKSGDWLVCNQGDTYTVDEAVFAQTYEQVSPGIFRKTATIWAWQATESGEVKTIEGSTDYLAGDYLIADSPDASPSYAISAEKFAELYAPVVAKV